MDKSDQRGKIIDKGENGMGVKERIKNKREERREQKEIKRERRVWKEKKVKEKQV